MIYTIPRYPVHLIDVVQVADGSRVTIRPTLPQDMELQRRFFRSLTAESRYCRFMTQLNELPESLAEHFASIDYRSHLALLAEVFEGGRETMIGEARYVVDARDPHICEFAVAVADNWQASGIARTLLDRLERQAALSGVRSMVADTLLTNAPMIGLARHLGYAVRLSRGGPELARLEKHLNPSAAPRSVRPLAAPEHVTAAHEQTDEREKTMTVKSNNPETMVLHAGPRALEQKMAALECGVAATSAP